MDYYNEIKKLLINNEINRIVKDYSKNKNDLNTYFNVGKLLNEYQKIGLNDKCDNIIKECSIKLTNEIGKGYSITNLKYMVKFYSYFKVWNELPIQLNWSHYVELLSLNNIDKINYYMIISLEENLSYRELHRKIKNKEYEKLVSQNKNIVYNKNNINNSFIKYWLNNINQQNNIELSIEIEKQLILENITNIMNKLGNNYCYVSSKYKIKIENDYNYIDLLLYNIEFNCYVVVILKYIKVNTKDIYQIKKYINYIDNHKKTINQMNTIGIVLCKKDNELLIKYCSDKRICQTSLNN